jgi:hypothetical protein
MKLTSSTRPVYRIGSAIFMSLKEALQHEGEIERLEIDCSPKQFRDNPDSALVLESRVVRRQEI